MNIMILQAEGNLIRGVPQNSLLLVQETGHIYSSDEVIEVNDFGEYHIVIFNEDYHLGKVTIHIED